MSDAAVRQKQLGVIYRIQRVYKGGEMPSGDPRIIGRRIIIQGAESAGSHAFRETPRPD